MSFIGVQMARHHSFANANEVKDGGVVIQNPSTAAFMVDSVDRSQPGNTITSSGNFIISKNQSLFNGFFRRLVLQEIVLDWGIPNIAQHPAGGDQVVDLTSVTITYQPAAGPSVQHTVFLDEGFYTAKECLDTLTDELDVAFGAGIFVIGGVDGRRTLEVDQTVAPGGTFSIQDTDLAVKIFGQVQIDRPLQQYIPILNPDTRYPRYIEFVSPQLTYNQNLKDSTTSDFARDVLYRWCMADDNVPQDYDAYGFPILQGYRPFISRRLIAYPKQILWNTNQPIGQIGFQVYDDDNNLIDPTGYDPNFGSAEMEFQMNFLMSEN